MTYGELFAAEQAVAKLGRTAWQSGKTSLQVAKLVKRYNEAIGPFREAKNSLIKTYGDEGQSINGNSEGWPEFEKAFNEAAQEEIEWTGEPFLTEEVLDRAKDNQLTSEDLLLLENLDLLEI